MTFFTTGHIEVLINVVMREFEFERIDTTLAFRMTNRFNELGLATTRGSFKNVLIRADDDSWQEFLIFDKEDMTLLVKKDKLQLIHNRELY